MGFTRHLVNDVGQYGSGTVILVDGIGGSSPQCFAPIVDTSVTNQVTWSQDTRNGGFDITTLAKIDGVTVSTPLTITSELNGKTLIVTTSGSNFTSNSTSVVLSYVSSSNFTLTKTGYTSTDTRPVFTFYGSSTVGGSILPYTIQYQQTNDNIDFTEDVNNIYVYGNPSRTSDFFIIDNTNGTACSLNITCNGYTKTYSLASGNTYHGTIAGYRPTVGTLYSNLTGGFKINITKT